MGRLRNRYADRYGNWQVSIYSAAKRSGLSKEDYEALIRETCSSWSQDGVKWMMKRYGRRYRGHLGLLGTAIVACYAGHRCHDYIVEPAVEEPKFLSRVRPDIALVLSNGILLLEVKMHHKEIGDVSTQIDNTVGKFYPLLRRNRVFLGTLHMFTTAARTGSRWVLPRWAAVIVLASKPQYQIYGEIDEAVKRFII